MVVVPEEFGTQLTRIRNTLKTDQERLNTPADYKESMWVYNIQHVLS